MNLALVNLAILICTSTMLCGAMMLSWRHFGRQRYALIWAASAACSAVQWTLNAIASAFSVDRFATNIVTGSLVILGVTLLAVGSRERTGLPLRLPLFAAAAIAATAAIVAVLTVYPNLALRGFIANAYSALMIALAAGAIFPRHRVVSMPEIVIFAVFLVFALLEMALALLSLGMGPNGSESGAEIYRNVLMIGLPATHSAMGIAAVFLLATDLNQRLEALITRDPLTGALNRRGFQPVATAALADARRHGRSLSVAICDIDGFKAFNYRWGYPLGDKVLIAFSDILLANVREEDIFGRIDGDGFALILIDSDAANSTHVVERARREFAALNLAGEGEIGLTASFGVAEFRAEDLHIGDIARRADQALQAARTAGRNRVATL